MFYIFELCQEEYAKCQYIKNKNKEVNITCFYSGLPFTCELCPEEDAPCEYMRNKRKEVNMSEDLEKKLKSESKQSKWYSIVTAIIVLVKTLVDIIFN